MKKLSSRELRQIILQEASKKSKKDLKDILDHKDVADVVHALHDGWAGEGGDGNLVSKTDWMKIGKIKEAALRSLISNHIKRMLEGCSHEHETGDKCPSCASGHACGCAAPDDDLEGFPMTAEEGHEGVSCEEAHPEISHDEYAEGSASRRRVVWRAKS